MMLKKSLYQPDELSPRPFVQTGARKPITSYRFQKFKDCQSLTGIEFAEDFKNRKNRLMKTTDAKIMRFKKEEMSLYNGPDAHIGEKTRRRKSQF